MDSRVDKLKHLQQLAGMPTSASPLHISSISDPEVQRNVLTQLQLKLHQLNPSQLLHVANTLGLLGWQAPRTFVDELHQAMHAIMHEFPQPQLIQLLETLVRAGMAPRAAWMRCFQQLLWPSLRAIMREGADEVAEAEAAEQAEDVQDADHKQQQQQQQQQQQDEEPQQQNLQQPRQPAQAQLKACHVIPLCTSLAQLPLKPGVPFVTTAASAIGPYLVDLPLAQLCSLLRDLLHLGYKPTGLWSGAWAAAVTRRLAELEEVVVWQEGCSSRSGAASTSHGSSSNGATSAGPGSGSDDAGLGSSNSGSTSTITGSGGSSSSSRCASTTSASGGKDKPLDHILGESSDGLLSQTPALATAFGLLGVLDRLLAVFDSFSDALGHEHIAGAAKALVRPALWHTVSIAAQQTLSEHAALRESTRTRLRLLHQQLWPRLLRAAGQAWSMQGGAVDCSWLPAVNQHLLAAVPDMAAEEVLEVLEAAQALPAAPDPELRAALVARLAQLLPTLPGAAVLKLAADAPALALDPAEGARLVPVLAWRLQQLMLQQARVQAEQQSSVSAAAPLGAAGVPAAARAAAASAQPPSAALAAPAPHEASSPSPPAPAADASLFSPADTLNLLWGLQFTSANLNSHLRAVLSACTEPMLLTSSPHQLLRLLTAMARLKCRPPERWLQAAITASQPHLRSMSFRQLVSLAWAFARLQAGPAMPRTWLEALYREVATRTAARAASPPSAATPMPAHIAGTTTPTTPAAGGNIVGTSAGAAPTSGSAPSMLRASPPQPQPGMAPQPQHLSTDSSTPPGPGPSRVVHVASLPLPADVARLAWAVAAMQRQAQKAAAAARESAHAAAGGGSAAAGATAGAPERADGRGDGRLPGAAIGGSGSGSGSDGTPGHQRLMAALRERQQEAGEEHSAGSSSSSKASAAAASTGSSTGSSGGGSASRSRASPSAAEPGSAFALPSKPWLHWLMQQAVTAFQVPDARTLAGVAWALAILMNADAQHHAPPSAAVAVAVSPHEPHESAGGSGSSSPSAAPPQHVQSPPQRMTPQLSWLKHLCWSYLRALPTAAPQSTSNVLWAVAELWEVWGAAAAAAPAAPVPAAADAAGSQERPSGRDSSSSTPSGAPIGSGSGSSSGSLPPMDSPQQLRRFLRVWALRLASSLHRGAASGRCKTQDLANAAAALAKLGCSPSAGWLTQHVAMTVAAARLQTPERATALHLSATLMAAEKMGWVGAAPAARAGSGGVTGDITAVAAADSCAGADPLLTSAVTTFVRLLPVAPPRALAEVLVALARMQQPARERAAAAPSLEPPSAQAEGATGAATTAAATAATPAAASVSHEGLAAAAAARPAAPAAGSDYPGPPGAPPLPLRVPAALVGSLLLSCQRHMGALSGQGLAMVAWALSTGGVDPPDRWLEAFQGAAYRARQRGELQPQSAATILWAVANRRWRMDPGFLSTLLPGARALHAHPLRALSISVWALGVLGLKPAAAWLAAMMEATAPRLIAPAPAQQLPVSGSSGGGGSAGEAAQGPVAASGAASAAGLRTMVVLAVGLWRMRVPPSRRWISQFAASLMAAAPMMGAVELTTALHMLLRWQMSSRARCTHVLRALMRVLLLRSWQMMQRIAPPAAPGASVNSSSSSSSGGVHGQSNTSGDQPRQAELLSHVLWCAARLHASQPPPAWLSLFWTVTAQLLPSFPSSALVGMMWSAAILHRDKGLRPPDQWLMMIELELKAEHGRWRTLDIKDKVVIKAALAEIDKEQHQKHHHYRNAEEEGQQQQQGAEAQQPERWAARGKQLWR